MIAEINQDADIFTLINIFTTSADRQAAVIAALSRFTETVTMHLPGFIGSSLHASLDGSRVLNYVQWRTEADHAAMMRHPEAAAHRQALQPLVDDVEPRPYRVASVRTLG
jgi:heme-degrading monooxygenase HmoA